MTNFTDHYIHEQVIALCSEPASVMKKLYQQAVAERARLDDMVEPLSVRLSAIWDNIMVSHDEMRRMMTDPHRKAMAEVQFTPDQADGFIDKMMADMRISAERELRSPEGFSKRISVGPVFTAWRYTERFAPQPLIDTHYAADKESELPNRVPVIPPIPSILAHKVKGGRERLGQIALAYAVLSSEVTQQSEETRQFEETRQSEAFTTLMQRFNETAQHMVDALTSAKREPLTPETAEAYVTALQHEAFAYAEPFAQMRPEIGRMVAGNRLPESWSPEASGRGRS